MSWVLIVWFSVASPAVITGFSSQDACEKAGRSFVEAVENNRPANRARIAAYVCVAKT